MFEIFTSSALTHYVLVFCFTLWQPIVFSSSVSEHTASSSEQK